MFLIMSVKQIEKQNAKRLLTPAFAQRNLEVEWSVIPCKNAIILEHKMP